MKSIFRIKKILYLLLTVSVIITACTEEPGFDNNISQPGNNSHDTEETITVSLYKNSDANIDGMYIDEADKFTSSGGWLFVSLGVVSGLGDISLIPLSKWSYSVAAKKGYGYIAYNTGKRQFYRLYISNSAADEMGTITGFQIKYERDFFGKDEAISFDKASFLVDAVGGNCSVQISNTTFIPCEFETDCDWIVINHVPDITSENSLEAYYGISFEVLPSNSVIPVTGTIVATSYTGKISTITVSRNGVQAWEPTTTIYDLKKRHWVNDENYSHRITESTVIRGKVVSSDKSGNVYKYIVVDDGSAAIEIAINSVQLYRIFPFGQEVAIDLKGWSIGRYRGHMQIGTDPSYDGGTIEFGQLENLEYQIINEPTTIEPIVTSCPEIYESLNTDEYMMQWQSRYVKIPEATFLKQGISLGSYHNDVIHTIYDKYLLEVNLWVSGYCGFISSLTPIGVGDICGILSLYNGGWRLVMNDVTDLKNFDPDKYIPREDDSEQDFNKPLGDGSLESPYNVESVLTLNNPGTYNWVGGYVVGYIPDMLISESVFKVPATVRTHFLMADSPDETDYHKCVPVQLPQANGDVRRSLNLIDNPGLLGSKVYVYGAFERYYSVNGVKDVTNFKL